MHVKSRGQGSELWFVSFWHVGLFAIAYRNYSLGALPSESHLALDV